MRYIISLAFVMFLSGCLNPNSVIDAKGLKEGVNKKDFKALFEEATRESGQEVQLTFITCSKPFKVTACLYTTPGKASIVTQTRDNSVLIGTIILDFQAGIDQTELQKDVAGIMTVADPEMGEVVRQTISADFAKNPEGNYRETFKGIDYTIGKSTKYGVNFNARLKCLPSCP